MKVEDSFGSNMVTYAWYNKLDGKWVELDSEGFITKEDLYKMSLQKTNEDGNISITLTAKGEIRDIDCNFTFDGGEYE